jgi:hypothetical protein
LEINEGICGGEAMLKEQKIAGLSTINVERIAFGVRFQPHFEIIDHAGLIVDRILRSDGSPFGPSFFPISERDPGEHRLLNPNTMDRLRLNQSDVILEMKVDTRKTSDIETSGKHFSAFILESLREVVNLSGIVRYGVVFRLEECHSVLQKTPIEHFLQQDFIDARSLSLRFTKRLPVLEALAKKGVDDYRNVIYTINQTEEGEVTILVDYQEIFKPELNTKEMAQKPYEDFVPRGIEYLLGDFQNWLNKLFKKQEAA